jgi:hypothetical protein
MPKTIEHNTTVILTKVLGVTATYIDGSPQRTLKAMDENPQAFLVWVRNRSVYALYCNALHFLGTVKEEYQDEFDKCSEPIVAEWRVTGGKRVGNFTYGLNLKLIMRDISDVAPTETETPF